MFLRNKINSLIDIRCIVPTLERLLIRTFRLDSLFSGLFDYCYILTFSHRSLIHNNLRRLDFPHRCFHIYFFNFLTQYNENIVSPQTSVLVATIQLILLSHDVFCSEKIYEGSNIEIFHSSKFH